MTALSRRRPTQEVVSALAHRLEQAHEPLRGDAYAGGGLDALFPRLTSGDE